uniref:Tripeptidyl-peptidase 2 n=1 Tax=Clastoptera arizonana TaxID=38151 RepID=A0A1B6CLJ0_9HEMI
MADISCDYPYSALLPKKETGVTSFLNKYPHFDGRGITIAIFDSGVDPGAEGLQVTSEGKPKIIERFDCSGAGDVDTSTVVEAVNGEIVGLTGRNLKIPSSWKNPSGKFHIGIKNAFELYPKKLQERIKKLRKEKLWDPGHKAALSESTRKLNNITKNLDLNKAASPSREEFLIKDEAQAQVDILTSVEKKFNDVGPIYDCILYHDGDMWRACLNVSETGDLELCHVLGEYSKVREYAPLTTEDSINYSINVHEDGNILEIVSLASSHGTHVAAIAAACFPDNPELNGVAPGAQIISLCIGDSRIDTEETGTALVRSMIRVMNAADSQKIHVINMSYGENTHFCNAGRIGDLMNEVVDKYGVVWVAAAGNQGPALSTVNTPPHINSTNIIGVSAYVSPEMMQAEYSLRQKLPGMPYTWTSRGPTIDGDKGVSICAPGGAIASVPNYTLQCTQLLNGTSMASPHVAGAVAVLLSGLTDKGVKYSPYSVKRSLENTAQFVDSMDVFAQGNGLLQVEKAFDHLVNFANAPERDVRFHITCGTGNNKGIYIRQHLQDKPREYSVFIEPVFANSDKVDPKKKIGFNLSLVLVCNATWVECPSHLELMNIVRMISVKVHLSGLPEGVHSTSIRAYDVKNPAKGPVFQIEVTVVRPQIISPDLLRPIVSFERVFFEPNTIKRHFIVVPDEVSWAKIRLQGLQVEKDGRFVVHCIQLLPKRSCKEMEFHKLVNIRAQVETVLSFQVKGGTVLEVVIAKYWANLGDITLNYSIEFLGIKPNGTSFTMHHADGLFSMDLHSGLQDEEISPQIQLKHFVSVSRPTEAKVLALHPRDTIPPCRPIYQLHLTYTFHLARAFEVYINNPLLSPFFVRI